MTKLVELPFRYETVTILPQDFDALNPDNPNARYRRLNGFRGAYNRAVDPVSVAKLASTWKSVVFGGTPLVLWQENPKDKFFYIISGQHRITMAAEAAKYGIPGPVQFRAEIRTPASIPLAGSLAEQVMGANLHARRQDGAQNLEIFQASSPWVLYANTLNWSPSFRTEQDQSQMSWKAIVHSAMLATALSRAKDIDFRVPYIRHEQILEEFQRPLTPYRQMLNLAYAWEQEVCVPTDAFRRKIRTRLRLRRHDALTVAFLLKMDPKNKRHAKALTEAHGKLVNSPGIAQMIPKTSGNFREIATNYLSVVNARRVKHRLHILNVQV